MILVDDFFYRMFKRIFEYAARQAVPRVEHDSVVHVYQKYDPLVHKQLGCVTVFPRTASSISLAVGIATFRCIATAPLVAVSLVVLEFQCTMYPSVSGKSEFL